MNDIDGWISRRLAGGSVTPALRNMIAEAVDAGFGWFGSEPTRLEFIRPLSDDRWEEIHIWVGATRTGRLGFKGAHHAIRTIDARTRDTAKTLAWMTPREET